MMADELLNAQDLITAKKHDTFHSEVITGKAGGLSTGANIDYATNAVTGQVQKTLPKILDDLDWSYVGLFADGVTFTDKTDFAVDAVGTQWIYAGSDPFPKTVPPATVPSAPDYQVVHVATAEALATTGGFSVQQHINGEIGKSHDQIYRRKATVAEIATGNFKVGDLQEVSDRANGHFNVVAGGAANGFDILSAGTGKTARTDITNTSVSALTSSTDLTSLFTHLAGRSEQISLTIPAGAYQLTSSVTLPGNITLHPKQGALITISAAAELNIDGEVIAPSIEIFAGDGSVCLDNSASGYNIAWFKTANGYANERFEFAGRGMKVYRYKKVLFSKPRASDSGVLNSGGRLFRYFNGPITIDDQQNNCDIYVDCEFYAQQNCDSFLKFTGTSKPENINIYGQVLAGVDPLAVVTAGIDVQSVARLSFWGNVILNGFQSSIRIGSEDMVKSVSDVNIPRAQCSFFYGTAVEIRGDTSVNNTQGVRIGNLTCTAAQVAGLSAVKMSGVLRNITVDNIVYATDIPKNGYAAVDAENVVEIDGDTLGSLATHIKIGSIYQANANNGLKIHSSIATTGLVSNVKCERIFGKFNGSAANVNYCIAVSIEEIENSSDVTVGSNASFVQIDSGIGMRNLINTGSNTIINGLGSQTRGAGVPPSPAVAWPIGIKIRETSDNKIYLRVAKGGLASDFVLLN